eukprot:12104649-Alexandrium_andersonii.AAC.1
MAGRVACLPARPAWAMAGRAGPRWPRSDAIGAVARSYADPGGLGRGPPVSPPAGGLVAAARPA